MTWIKKLDAAQRRFALRRRAIEELAARDEEFRLLCIDLADAETVAQHWADSDAPKHDERHAEYLLLADELAKEIEAALNSASIIPLIGPGPADKK